MKEYLNDVGQLRMMWESIRNAMLEDQGYEKISNELIDSSLLWILEKQQQYSGDVYLEKIENNAIYLNEAAWSCLEVAADYLCNENPIVPQNQIESFVWTIRQNAFEPTELHQKFIRFGCSGCSEHNTHNRYQRLFQMRRNARREVYLEEIEFWCICFQMKFTVVQEFLKIFLNYRDMAGIAQNLPRDEVVKVLSERADLTVQLLGNLMTLSPDGKPQPTTQKTWRRIWGKELKILLRNKPGIGKKWYEFWK